MNINKAKLACRTASVRIKIIAGVVGVLAAALWYLAAATPGAPGSVGTNVDAAIATGVAMLFQSAAAIIDAWISPTASWG